MEELTNISKKVRSKEINGSTFICLSDLARISNPKEYNYLISCWFSLKNTVEYLAFWERINNPEFDEDGLVPIWEHAGENAFILYAKEWVDRTKAKGVMILGKDVYSHNEIALKFAGWLSVSFELFIYREIHRLQEELVLTSGNTHQLDKNLLARAITNIEES